MVLNPNETAKAYIQCRSFADSIKEKKSDVDIVAKDLIEKYPETNYYLNFLVNLDNVKNVETEVKMLNKVIKFLKQKRNY